MLNYDYTNLASPQRTIKGKVELSNGSSTFTAEDALKDFKIERVGEKGKFFGFGIVQKLEVNLVDANREISIEKGEPLKPWLSAGEEPDYVTAYPTFYAEEPKRDEKTNAINVIAYDKLNAATAHTVSELNLDAPYTIGVFAQACANLLGVPLKDELNASFNIRYEEGANFEGTETIRDALNAIAEATQTIYFLDNNDFLIFKSLDILDAPVLTIDNEQYIELSCKASCFLTSITHATELGDNLTASNGRTGVTQTVRDNPFWELREDITQLLDEAIATVGDTEITPFECNWRGNFLLEIGDKIGLTTKDNTTVLTYVLDDSLTYNGGLSEHTQWSYSESENESSTPTTLGEVIKQTYAKVDKANKKIELVASETGAAISSLEVDTVGIRADVSRIEEVTQEALEGATDDIAELKTVVSAQLTSEDVTLAIQSEMQKGTDKVTTSTGFTFNEEGLTVEKTNSEMKTQITEDGMKIYRNEEQVLTADNAGVNARNLHATTYLIIGTNCRLEDYGSGRTACFWIGGNS